MLLCMRTIQLNTKRKAEIMNLAEEQVHKGAGEVLSESQRNGGHSMSIKGGVAVVTGAAGGIGRALTLELAKRKVAGLAVVDRSEGVQHVAKAINELAGSTVAAGFNGDVTDPKFRHQVYEEMEGRYGTVNLCVPAAGITRDNL